jgi:hypothetical protein
MQTECCSCGYCRENDKNSTGLDVQEGQWLEELGDMIEAAVEGLRKEQSFTAGCNGRLTAA